MKSLIFINPADDDEICAGCGLAADITVLAAALDDELSLCNKCGRLLGGMLTDECGDTDD